MSSCEDHGKDKVVFLTKEDTLSSESKVELSDMPAEHNRGLILPNGDINFSCPCLGGMASGPCGFEFREAFSCFHYSTEEVKGSECLDKFFEMQNCMTKYPNLYANENAAMDTMPDDMGDSPADQIEHSEHGKPPSSTTTEVDVKPK